MLRELEECLNDDSAAVGMERAFLSRTPKVEIKEKLNI